METRESIIRAWKNPEIRPNIREFGHPAGDALLELEADELAGVQGGVVGINTYWITSLLPPFVTVIPQTFPTVSWRYACV